MIWLDADSSGERKANAKFLNMASLFGYSSVLMRYAR